MVRIRHLCAIATIACAQAPPDAAELTKLIAAVRQNALGYSRNLPNFICTQQTVRSIDPTGTGAKWEKRDTLDLQLTYFGRRENYQLLAVNGKLPRLKDSLGMGVTSSGEFGSMLDQLFEPEAGAAFTWLRWETLRGQPMHVFSLRVDQSRSIARVSVPGRTILVGYHGEVYVDRNTKTVWRVVIFADVPEDFPLKDISHVIDYGLVPVGGEEFLLPLHTEMRTRAPESMLRDGVKRLRAREVLMRNVTDFVLYRKYTADAAIRFDSDDKAKKDR
jgi:hypothetical protein